MQFYLFRYRGEFSLHLFDDESRFLCGCLNKHCLSRMAIEHIKVELGVLRQKQFDGGNLLNYLSQFG